MGIDADGPPMRSPWYAVLALIVLLILIPVYTIAVPMRTEPILEIEEWVEENGAKLVYCGVSPFRWKKAFLPLPEFMDKLDEIRPDEVWYSTIAGYNYFFYTKTTTYIIEGLQIN